MKHSIQEYQQLFNAYLLEKSHVDEPVNLYEPIDYILKLGGKRLRPVLTLMAAEIFGTDCKKALDAALAIEVFHNFSLVHDDIMDRAPTRRGQETVHKKWDVNTGILSGDAMLIVAFRYLESYEGTVFKRLTKLFSKTALQVCEGQQYDIDFEQNEEVSIGAYIKMITYKTAVLVAAALKMGAIIADTKKENEEAAYLFGSNLGIAFQIQDDYLDAFGDPKTFGKQLGGDIIENKKTFLYIKALEHAEKKDAETLKHLFSIQPEDSKEKIAMVKRIFERSGAVEKTREAIVHYTENASSVVNDMFISENRKQLLHTFSERLMNRTI